MSKDPWEEWPEIWPTKSKFFSWLRGGIRKGVWNRSPIKLEVIKHKRKRVVNPKTGNTVNGGTCYICNKDFIQKDLQVDHIIGEHSLKEFSDVQKFIEAMTCLSADDLDLICKPCHKIKSYSEKNNISIEEARIEKQVIEFGKLIAKVQREKLQELGIEPKSTIKSRKNQYMKKLEELKLLNELKSKYEDNK